VGIQASNLAVSAGKIRRSEKGKEIPLNTIPIFSALDLAIALLGQEIDMPCVIKIGKDAGRFRTTTTAIDWRKVSCWRPRQDGRGNESKKRFRKKNQERHSIWCPDNKPDLSFRGLELGGEVGEVQNVIKKT